MTMETKKMTRTTEDKTNADVANRLDGVVVCDLRQRFTENAEQFDALMVKMLAENERLRLQYDELIMAVARKFPGESRHETALKYIRAEELSTCNETALKYIRAEQR